VVVSDDIDRTPQPGGGARVEDLKARTSDPDTSHIAAAVASRSHARASRLCELLRAFGRATKDGGPRGDWTLTPWEAIRNTGIENVDGHHQASWRGAVSSLKKEGYVERIGKEKVIGNEGMPVMTLVLTDKGVQELWRLHNEGLLR
jgi:hypothetical protein